MSQLPAMEPRRISSVHIPALDGVRGLAILLVLVGHLIALPPVGLTAKLLGELARIGWIGVDLFFVLSGFLITGILVDSRDDRGYFRSFYIRRALRIFPLYYVFLLGIFALALHLAPHSRNAKALLSHEWWYWTYTVNALIARNGSWAVAPFNTFHLWSLAVEEQFYLVWPLLVWVVPRRRLGAVCAGAMVVSFAARLFLHLHGAAPVALYALTITHLDPIAIGALVAIAVRAPDGLARLRRWAPVVGAASAGALIAIIVTAHGVSPSDTVPMQLVGYPVVGLFCAALLITALAAPAGWVDRLVGRGWTLAPLRYIGRRSYAIYLLHFPLLYAAENAGFTYPHMAAVTRSPLLGQAVFFVGIVGISVAAAELSWRLLEGPILQLRSHFRRPGVPRASAPVPRALG